MQDAPEGADRRSVAQHTSKHPIAAILLLAEAVAMFNVRAPSTNDAVQGPEAEVNSGVAQHVAAPAVVIPGEHRHGKSGIAQVHQRGEHPHSAARHDRLPLEPELEQVAVDQ